MSPIKLHDGATIDLYSALTDAKLALPYTEGGISAGFPSPALDFMEQRIDLNVHLIKHPSSTFYGRVKGQSLKDAGIDDGDLLIIDKSLEPVHGKIAVCFIDGEFTAKRIHFQGDELWLKPENPAYPSIKVIEEHHLIVWGVVTHVIKSF